MTELKIVARMTRPETQFDPALTDEPLVTLSSAQSAIAERDARIAELERELKREAQLATSMAEDRNDAEARAEAAEALLKEAKTVLEPFVTAFNKAHSKYAARYGDSVEIGFARFDTMPDSWAMDNITFSMGEFRAARSLMSKIGERNGE